MDVVIKFTEQSKDPNNYNKLHANLRVPYTQYSNLVIDSLTTNCCIEVLNQEDFITFNVADTDLKIQMNDSYSSLNASSISTVLNGLLAAASSTILTSVDNTNRLVFASQIAFSITDCSYRMKDILGFYDQDLPIQSNSETIDSELYYTVHPASVGNYLSTPILYLIASIGEKCFITGSTNKKILMRINNSYSANFPVIANNAEFSTYALSNDFSDITFELVDARFKPIKLLCPMYLCGTITGDIKAETINTSIFITPNMLGNNTEAPEAA